MTTFNIIDQATYEVLRDAMKALQDRLNAIPIVPLTSAEAIELEKLRKLFVEQQDCITEQHKALKIMQEVRDVLQDTVQKLSDTVQKQTSTIDTLNRHKIVLKEQVESLENSFDLIKKTIGMRYAVPSKEPDEEVSEARQSMVGELLPIPAACNPSAMKSCPICKGGPCKFGLQSPHTMPKPVVERKGKNED